VICFFLSWRSTRVFHAFVQRTSMIEYSLQAGVYWCLFNRVSMNLEGCVVPLRGGLWSLCPVGEHELQRFRVELGIVLLDGLHDFGVHDLVPEAVVSANCKDPLFSPKGRLGIRVFPHSPFRIEMQAIPKQALQLLIRCAVLAARQRFSLGPSSGMAHEGFPQINRRHTQLLPNCNRSIRILLCPCRKALDVVLPFLGIVLLGHVLADWRWGEQDELRVVGLQDFVRNKLLEVLSVFVQRDVLQLPGKNSIVGSEEDGLRWWWCCGQRR
jgi:hypothetical protein